MLKRLEYIFGSWRNWRNWTKTASDIRTATTCPILKLSRNDIHIGDVRLHVQGNALMCVKVKRYKESGYFLLEPLAYINTYESHVNDNVNDNEIYAWHLGKKITTKEFKEIAVELGTYLKCQYTVPVALDSFLNVPSTINEYFHPACNYYTCHEYVINTPTQPVIITMP